MPLCLTFIDLGEAFDTVETEAVLEALATMQTGISPFYDDITIDVKRGVRQGDTVSPKLFTATLEDIM
ncbi:hypothetical protein ANCCEY_04656 [Ancylostoma ceylanicum]|uniref:Reverse transcriptase domain-containing protein n=1 Tax=Ancylostoma ceylanicum TaxID=53326 RepID=A0A0D6LWM4_9BILA|nr:hypothetical protein ANCCEY_04656 [Ancylostoma ceylanicum]